MSGKTPIGYLQEWCTKHSLTPVYELLAGEGRVHSPIFAYKCTVGQHSAIGKGASKKAAKHCSAQGVLNVILGDKNPVTYPFESDHPNSASEGGNLAIPDALDNPVGQLQEIAQQKLLRPPVYDYLEAEQCDSNPRGNFVCEVKLGKLTTTGRGRCKRSAKRAAALAMLEEIKSLSGDVGDKQKSLEDSEDNISAIIAYEKMRYKSGSGLRVLNDTSGLVVRGFFEALQSAKGKYLEALQELMLSNEGDYVQHLADLAKEQKFNVSYLRLNELSLNGEVHVLAQLSTLPVAVLFGSGADEPAAQRAAAKNALQYLKIMTKTGSTS